MQIYLESHHFDFNSKVKMKMFKMDPLQYVLSFSLI